MRKLIVGAALALGVVSIGGTAFAGEVTGSGRGGPNGDGIVPARDQAASECAFSGLEDGEEGGTAGPGNTQNWGQIVRQAGPLGGVPGDACNPSSSS